ncbi:unnamed protein product [Adineta ricciae]|uniref:F-box domain-containing protein n=1 Tax=Adineta ricciae TaxID=249248 RepID=A0A815QCI7_ADIRI|nr:unnamed protein product [Adineta ricciae]
MHTFSTLPVEIVYRIMDHQNDETLFCSMQNISRRLNQILSTYERYRTLTELSLYWNGIGTKGAQHIANALRTNTTLTTLNLGYNRLGDGGAQHIADALGTNTTLATLILLDNGIGAEGAKHIADALRTNTTLTTLNLSWNGIGAEGAQHIADALRTNTTLTTLDIGYNEIGYEVAQRIADALRTNTTLTTLILDSNQIGDEVAQHIADALRRNASINMVFGKKHACEIGLSNGTQGIFRELIYDDQKDPSDLKIKSEIFPSNAIYIRKPLYALVELNASQVVTNLDGLRRKLIPIPLIKKQFTVPIRQLFGHLLDRVQNERRIPQVIQVTRTQLPIVPAFAITTYKAYGLTMNKIVVDLQVPFQTLQVVSVYVPLSRVKRAEHIVILRTFDMKVLPVRPSLAQDARLKRLDELDKKTKRQCTFFIS